MQTVNEDDLGHSPLVYKLVLLRAPNFHRHRPVWLLGFERYQYWDIEYWPILASIGWY